MSPLSSAIKGLTANKKGLQGRRHRVSLAFVVYLIWDERHRRVFENPAKSVDNLFRKFQILFYIILYFHETDHLA